MNLSLIYDQPLRDALAAIEKRALNHLTINPSLAPGGTNTNFQVSAFSYLLDGITYNKAAANNIAPPGASTDAGEFRKVLVCIDSAGAVSTVTGDIAESQADAPVPATPASKLAIGVLELPASFTSGTTAVTAGMCKPILQSIV